MKNHRDFIKYLKFLLSDGGVWELLGLLALTAGIYGIFWAGYCLGLR